MINGRNENKHQKATFLATNILLSSENPEKFAIIPLKADPSAIESRMKVGIEPDAWTLSFSGNADIILLDTKLQDIPNPIPIIAENIPIKEIESKLKNWYSLF